MTFANPLPIWGLVLVSIAAATLAWSAYARVPLSRQRRLALAGLRLLTLIWLVACLMRPVSPGTLKGTSDAIVPILVDDSRSMGLRDADGERRIDRARAAIDGQLVPAISAHFRTEVLRFGERVSPAQGQALFANERATALGRALQEVRERYRGRAVAGIILVSDGGDNGDVDVAAAAAAGAPVFALGVGPRHPARDREVVSVTTAESVLVDSVVDVAVAAVSHGYGTSPFNLRLLENGRPVDVRRVTPAADGVPVSATFHVSPNRDVPTVYAVEVPAAGDELVAENNTRSALVPPAGRRRRVLLVQGAPGYEHAFLRRAWTGDTSLDVDSVVRKGRDDSGGNTFYVQAPRPRADALLGGYPNTREALFAYDVIVLANVDADSLTAGQLELTRAFVSERGGGLLVLGARGFQRQGMRDTPIEDVLPLQLSDRTGGVVPAAVSPGMNRVALTRAGAEHPCMQLGATPDENEKRWAAVPPLASVSPLGEPRPGATVLAVTGGTGGAARALIAVQRYGRGRSMAFTGEASWRWRMMLPVADTSYDRFWRQAVRWLGQTAPDPVTVDLPAAPAPGDAIRVEIEARDAAFAPQGDAAVDLRVAAADGRVEVVQAAPIASRSGRYEASVHAPQAGIYRVSAAARRGSATLGTATASLLVGGVDPEMIDPRLNEEVLQRVARASGGEVIATQDLERVLARLRTAAPVAALALRRDLWSTGWSFAVIAGLLAAEWLMRRKWGLR